MALPQIKTAVYNAELPVAGKVQYRPITVKEEGALLTATEFGQPGDILTTLKQTISDCITSGQTIDDLLLIEFIYLVILIRTRSKSNILTLVTECDKCEKKFEFDIDLDAEKFFINEEVLKTMVEINKDLALELIPMKAKDIDLLFNLENAKDKIDATLDLLESSVAKIIYEKKIYTSSEFGAPGEVKSQVLDNLTSSDIEKLVEKLTELIQFKIVKKVTCEHCKHEQERVYDEPLSFLE